MREHDTPEGFRQATVRRRLDAAGARIDWQLEYLRDEAYTHDNGARPNSAKFAILVVDNRASNPDETLVLANQLKDAGVTLLVVGVGDHVDTGELEGRRKLHV